MMERWGIAGRFRRSGLTLLLLVTIVATLGGPLTATASPAAELKAAAGGSARLAMAVRWLRAQQQADGGFGLPTSDGGLTTDVALALAAVGIDPASVRTSGGRSLDEYLLAIAPTYGARSTGAAKLALAVLASGRSPRTFGGVDLIAALGSPNAEGRYGQSLYEHTYHLLALAGAGATVPPTAIDYLRRGQLSDGAWSFAGPGQPGEGDTNTTAVVIQALVAIDDPVSLAATEKGLVYLLRARLADGGFVYAPGQENPPLADANSTALALQASLALSLLPAPIGPSSVARLAAFQNESGAFRWRNDQPGDNLFATVQAVPALAGTYLPFRAGTASGDRQRRLAAVPRPASGSDSAERRFFPETGHSLSLGFKAYWEANGGLAIFGLPLTEEFSEQNPADGRVYTVQYFERARFEYHPEQRETPYETQLGLIGWSAVDGRTEPAFVRQPGGAPDCQFFAPTGQAICGDFAAFWQTNGGLAIFGLPISSAFEEEGVMVQYFERARFERRAGTVQLGLLGRELLYPALGGR